MVVALLPSFQFLPGIEKLVAQLSVLVAIIRLVVYEWAAAGFKDTLLRWKMKLEVADGHEKEIQPRVQA